MAAADLTSQASLVEQLTGELLDSYAADARALRVSRRYLPSREAIVEILQSLLDLMYPGYFGRRDLTLENLAAHVAQQLNLVAPKIEREIEHCLCYARERQGVKSEFG